MGEQDKYYIPSIEDFHIGFEYEWNSPDEDDVWRSTIADLEDCYHSVQDIQQKLNYNNYRIKYLDKEDIESLGFRFYQEDKNYIDFYLYDKNNTRLTLCKRDNGRIIIKNNGQLFIDIIIKNKSELKILLKQLNIIK